MATLYWTVFSATLAIVISAFFKDRDVSKANLQDWGFVITAALVWPVTLPFIISHKLKIATTARRRAAKQMQVLQAEADTPVFPV